MNRASTIILIAVTGLAFGCKDKDKSAEDQKGGTTAKSAETKGATDKPVPAPVAKPVVKKAPTAVLAIAEWGVEMQAAEGSKIIDLENDPDMPASAKVTGACGEDAELEIIRHGKDALEGQFKNATSLTEFNSEYVIKEQSEAGYKVKRSWVPPLGKTWGADVGVVVGDHLFICGIGSMFGVEDESAADCAIAACASLKASAK